MVADTNYNERQKLTPEEIIGHHRAIADHDINYQNRQINEMGSSLAHNDKSLRRSFALASLALVASVLAGVVSYSALTVPVEERPREVDDSRQEAKRICAEKVAAGHITNSDAEVLPCQKIFYAEGMENASKEYTLGGGVGVVFTLGLLGFAFSNARDGREALKGKRDLQQGLDQANQKLLCASASFQTADAIYNDLNVQ